MTRRAAYLRFVAAVLALSEDPARANVERYLASSRELEASRRSRQMSGTQRSPVRDR